MKHQQLKLFTYAEIRKDHIQELLDIDPAGPIAEGATLFSCAIDIAANAAIGGASVFENR